MVIEFDKKGVKSDKGEFNVKITVNPGTDGEGGEIFKLNKEINTIKVKDVIDVEYKRLIKDKSIIWDGKSLELDYDTFQKSMVELDRIKLLRENLKDYELISHNNRIEFALNILVFPYPFGPSNTIKSHLEKSTIFLSLINLKLLISNLLIKYTLLTLLYF